MRCAARSGALMQAAVQAGSDALAERSEKVVVAGERNLLAVQDVGERPGQPAAAVRPVRAEDRADAPAGGAQPRRRRAHLLGGESQVVPFEELWVVSAPYEVDGRIVGTLGVIGPTRMASTG